MSFEKTPALAKSSSQSMDSWRRDLKSLFDQAKERFSDVVWELFLELDDERLGPCEVVEEVWAHKAMIYARAPPSFLAQYFDVRPSGDSRLFGASSPNFENPTQSTFSLPHYDDERDRYATSPQLYPHFSSSSPVPSVGEYGPGIMRLTTDVAPALFANQLEFLYTGSGIGAAFDFLFDSKEQKEASIISTASSDVEQHRIDKLRKDLVFMWRSRLYSDVKIELTGSFSRESEEATAVFSSHRFILASRSPYFRSLFLGDGFQPASIQDGQGTELSITLPSPPFTPASLHFTLGYIYTGTLAFSNRTFDLVTAFQIYRAALYLSLDDLQAEIEAYLVEDMLHGLFHAYLSFEEYEKVTGGRWGVGGDRCKVCARRIPRVLEFASSSDVANAILERGARRALVGIFGEGWATSEFASLNTKAKTSALKGVNARTISRNVLQLLFAAEGALKKLDSPNTSDQAWASDSRDLILSARKRMDEVLCGKAEEVFEQEEWLTIMEGDGQGFDDGDRVQWVMGALRRGLSDGNAGSVYQVLVSSVLLRSRPSNVDDQAVPLLSSTSPIRAQVERARLDIVKWLRKRWISVRLANGFEGLEGWALKEISDELDVPVEDLLSPAPSAHAPQKAGSPARRRPLRPPQDDDSTSVAQSLRASVLNRNAARNGRGEEDAVERDDPASSRSSSHSIPNSVRSTARISSVAVQPPAQGRRQPPTPSASTAASSSNASSSKLAVSNHDPGSVTQPSESVSHPHSSTSPAVVARPKSLAPSVNSIRSTASNATVKRTKQSAPSPARAETPQSDVSTTYRTAVSDAGSSRPGSVMSSQKKKLLSSPAGETPARLAPPAPRQRTLSSTSATSASSAVSMASRARRISAKSPTPVTSPGKRSTSSARPRVQSDASTKSSTRPKSTTSSASLKKAANQARSNEPPVPPIPKAGDKGNPKFAGSRTPTSGPGSKASSTSSTGPVMIPKDQLATAAVAAVAARELKKSKSMTSTTTNTTSQQSGHSSHPSDASVATVKGAPPALPKTKQPEGSTRSASQSTAETTTPRASVMLAEVELSSQAPATSLATRLASSKRDGSSAPPIISSAPSPSQSIVESPSLQAQSRNPSMASSVSSDAQAALEPPSPLGWAAEPAQDSVETATWGIQLHIGIPCMIALKRSRFKGLARYIGEVKGSSGPWVGIEVPISENAGWSSDRLRRHEKAWNDGSFRGVRYFEIGVSAVAAEKSLASSLISERNESVILRQKRLHTVLGGSLSSSFTSASTESPISPTFGIRKRDPDAFNFDNDRHLRRLRSPSPSNGSDVSASSESRGMFVRPSQILLVIDAKDH